jgi:hypothetical protein
VRLCFDCRRKFLNAVIKRLITHELDHELGYFTSFGTTNEPGLLINVTCLSNSSVACKWNDMEGRNRKESTKVTAFVSNRSMEPKIM